MPLHFYATLCAPLEVGVRQFTFLRFIRFLTTAEWKIPRDLCRIRRRILNQSVNLKEKVWNRLAQIGTTPPRFCSRPEFLAHRELVKIQETALPNPLSRARGRSGAVAVGVLVQTRQPLIDPVCLSIQLPIAHLTRLVNLAASTAAPCGLAVQTEVGNQRGGHSRSNGGSSRPHNCFIFRAGSGGDGRDQRRIHSLSFSHGRSRRSWGVSGDSGNSSSDFGSLKADFFQSCRSVGSWWLNIVNHLSLQINVVVWETCGWVVLSPAQRGVQVFRSNASGSPVQFSENSAKPILREPPRSGPLRSDGTPDSDTFGQVSKGCNNPRKRVVAPSAPGQPISELDAVVDVEEDAKSSDNQEKNDPRCDTSNFAVWQVGRSRRSFQRVNRWIGGGHSKDHRVGCVRALENETPVTSYRVKQRTTTSLAPSALAKIVNRAIFDIVANLTALARSHRERKEKENPKSRKVKS